MMHTMIRVLASVGRDQVARAVSHWHVLVCVCVSFVRVFLVSCSDPSVLPKLTVSDHSPFAWPGAMAQLSESVCFISLLKCPR